MFKDRATAGTQLANEIQQRGIVPETIVAINSGGLPVGKQVADRFSAPLNSIIVSQIAAPFNRELSIGAVTSDGTHWVNDERIDKLGIDKVYVEDGIRVETKHAADQAKAYNLSPLDVDRKTVVLTSDGTENTAVVHAVAKQLYGNGAQSVIYATPILAVDARDELTSTLDEIIALETPTTFTGAAQHYELFKQLSDDDVQSYLKNGA